MAETSFEAYSYRTSARYGSRVWISIEEDTVTVIGPRVGVLVYQLWIAAQWVLLTLVPLALLATILWDWRFLFLVLGLLVAHVAVGGFGAACLWELENLVAFAVGTKGKTTSFSLGAVKRVTIGRGWARKGLWLMLLPYVGGINKMSRGLCVSFEAPDGETGRDGVYALHMRNTEEAQALAKLLERRA